MAAVQNGTASDADLAALAMSLQEANARLRDKTRGRRARRW